MVFAGLDAEQHLVGLGVFAVQVVTVVGGHQRQVEGLGHLQQPLVDHVLLGQGVLLQLDVVAARKQFAVPAGGLQRIIHPVAAALHGYFALEAGRQSNQAATVLGQELTVDAGAVVEAFLVAGRGQVREVFVTLQVFAEQDQVVGRLGDPLGVFGKAGVGGQVDLAADDRLDAGLLALEIEFNRAEHVAVVGDGQGLHAGLLGLGNQVLNPNGAVQERVLTVQVQVDEGGGRRRVGCCFHGLSKA